MSRSRAQYHGRKSLDSYLTAMFYPCSYLERKRQYRLERWGFDTVYLIGMPILGDNNSTGDSTSMVRPQMLSNRLGYNILPKRVWRRERGGEIANEEAASLLYFLCVAVNLLSIEQR
jgi:hypothetical protein